MQPAPPTESTSGDAAAAVEQRAKQLAEEAENLHRRALADKRKTQIMQGPFTPKQVIAMLELPWQEKIGDEKLDQAAASLKPVADEAVDEIMRAFNRNDQAFA